MGYKRSTHIPESLNIPTHLTHILQLMSNERHEADAKSIAVLKAQLKVIESLRKKLHAIDDSKDEVKRQIADQFNRFMSSRLVKAFDIQLPETKKLVNELIHQSRFLAKDVGGTLIDSKAHGRMLFKFD